jgi:prefoldin alpha subunit
MSEENYKKIFEIQQNIQLLQKYLEDIEMQSQELEMIHEAIQDFEKTKKDSEILVPIVNGMFFKAKLTDNTKFLVNIGADRVVVEMDIKESKSLILKQIEQSRENQILMTQELEKFIKQLKELE